MELKLDKNEVARYITKALGEQLGVFISPDCVISAQDGIQYTIDIGDLGDELNRDEQVSRFMDPILSLNTFTMSGRGYNQLGVDTGKIIYVWQLIALSDSALYSIDNIGKETVENIRRATRNHTGCNSHIENELRKFFLQYCFDNSDSVCVLAKSIRRSISIGKSVHCYIIGPKAEFNIIRTCFKPSMNESTNPEYKKFADHLRVKIKTLL